MYHPNIQISGKKTTTLFIHIPKGSYLKQCPGAIVVFDFGNMVLYFFLFSFDTISRDKAQHILLQLPDQLLKITILLPQQNIWGSPMDSTHS